MKRRARYGKWILRGGLLLLLTACSSPQDIQEEHLRRINRKGEYIYRRHDEVLFPLATPEQQPPEPYPWSGGQACLLGAISKEQFRCKGNSLNPLRLEYSKSGQPRRHVDCEGGNKHSLPLVNGREFVYPVLLELLNEVHAKTGLPLVITTGHRCPAHNVYADSSAENKTSKHQLGAEVDFYVQGLENQPDKVVQILLDYYKKHPVLSKDPAMRVFQRYEKGDCRLVTKPWYNKEVFIKLYKKNEGRDFDNRHPYPYLSIQVRYDRDSEQNVTFSWEKSQNGYIRW